MKQTCKSGYIIPLALVLISTAVIITTAIFLRGTLFSSFADTIIKKEKAKLLALSGAQIAISQLADRPKKEEQEKKEKAAASATPQTRVPELLKQIIPILNRWQLFPLKEAVDGIDGEIRIKISCEDGKIPINQIIDFQKQQYKGEKQPQGDWKQFMDMVMTNVGKLMKSTDLQNQLVGYIKKEKKPFLDVSQMLLIPGWQVFNEYQFARPLPAQEKKVFLTDLFTIETEKPTIDPWTMSESLLTALNLKSPTPEIRTKNAEIWIRTYKSSLKFPDDWKTIFMPIYEKDWKSLPKGMEHFFAKSFDPTCFSVVSYGKVGDITQSVYLILQRIKRTVKGKSISQIIIKKAYWF